MTGHGEAAVTTDLVEMNPRRYVFLEHSLPSSGDSPVFTVAADSLRSYVVIRGQIEVRRLDIEEAEAARYSYLAGWHAWGVAFKMFSASREAAVVLEAGVDDVSPGRR